MYDRRSQLANSWAAKSQQERHFMRACQQFYAPAAAEPILLRSLLLFRITVKEKKEINVNRNEEDLVQWRHLVLFKVIDLCSNT